MNRAALEHILRAAAAVANEPDIIVIGSQAVLGQFPDAPGALLVSIEADVFPRHAPPEQLALLQTRLIRVEATSRSRGPQ